jgi:hypothetical protein
MSRNRDIAWPTHRARRRKRRPRDQHPPHKRRRKVTPTLLDWPRSARDFQER